MNLLMKHESEFRLCCCLVLWHQLEFKKNKFRVHLVKGSDAGSAVDAMNFIKASSRKCFATLTHTHTSYWSP